MEMYQGFFFLENWTSSEFILLYNPEEWFMNLFFFPVKIPFHHLIKVQWFRSESFWLPLFFTLATSSTANFCFLPTTLWFGISIFCSPKPSGVKCLTALETSHELGKLWQKKNCLWNNYYKSCNYKDESGHMTDFQNWKRFYLN